MRFFKRDMSKERKELSGEELINFFLWTIILVLPWVMSAYGYDSYYLPKAVFLWLVTPLVLVLIIKYKLNWSKEKTLLLVYLSIVLLSSILAENKLIAFLGQDPRYEGFVVIVIYTILFLGATKYLKLNKKIISIMLNSVSTMGIYSILQFYKIDPLPKDPFHDALKGSAFGTIGNRNFMGSFIIIFLTLAIATYIYLGSKRYLIYSGILFGSLIATMTRGCWVAFAVVLAIGFLTILKRKECYKRVGISLLVFICIFGIMNITSSGQVSDRTNTIKEELVDKDKRSGSGRIDIWKMTGVVISNHKLIGVGPENLNDSLREEANEQLKLWEKRTNTTVDRAHNEYIQIAANSGVFALLTYLVLISLILKRVIKNYNDDRYKIIGLMIVGYLVQAFFNISVVGVAPLFWILLGLSTNEEEVKKLRLN